MSQRSTVNLVIRMIIPLLILAVGVFGYWAIVTYGKKPTVAKKPEKVLPPLVHTAPVEMQTDGLTIDTDGIVVPYREITLNAEVAGRLTYKADTCRAGNYVKQGTLLMKIDPVDYDLEVQRLKKEVEQTKTGIREIEGLSENTKPLIQLARDSLKLQRQQLHRIETLETKKAVSRSKLDAERRNELVARDALIKLENQLRIYAIQKDRFQIAMELAQVKLNRAQRDLARTEVTAPIDGMVIRDYVESDAYVNRGERLFSMEDVSAVEVRCNLRMDELFWIWSQASPENQTSPGKGPNKTDQNVVINRSYTPPPTPTSITYTLAGRDYIWEGVLSRYEGIGLDESTRTVPCTVMVNDPDNVRVVAHNDEKSPSAGQPGTMALVRGMYVQLEIHAKPQQALLRIPESALRPGKLVWRVRKERLSIVPVRVLSTMDSGVVIEPVKKNDLVAGDLVVIEPLAVAEENMLVRIAKETTSQKPVSKKHKTEKQKHKK